MSILRCLTLVLAVAVASCANSPAPRYFRLEPLAGALAPAAAGEAVVVGPFDFPEYLDRPQIITRDGANVLALADYERWAEPLAASFQSVLAADVGRLLGSDRVLEFPAGPIVAGSRRVTGRVLRFDVDATGRAVLEVQWGVVDGTGGVLQPGRVSRHEARAAGRDAAAGVAALNTTVAAFSAEVAAVLR